MAVDARVVRGDTSSLSLIAQVGGNPINLTGLTVRFSARYDPGDAEAVLEKSTGGGGVVVPDPTSGEITVLIDAEDTAGLPARPLYLYFDVEVSDDAGHRFTPVVGVLELRSDVTH